MSSQPSWPAPAPDPASEPEPGPDPRVPATPHNEAERLAALRSLEVLDTEPELEFERIVRLARLLLDMPIAVVSLVDEDRQWFKAIDGLEAKQTSRQDAFCAHAILDDQVLVVEDATSDVRFVENPLVTGEPRIRFYAGAPLSLTDDLRLGTLCVIDRKPRSLTSAQVEALRDLAGMVVDALRLRKQLRDEVRARAELAQANEDLDLFSRAVAHDLVAPLRHVAFLTNCIRSDHLDVLSEDGVDLLMRTERAGEEAARMVRALANLARSRVSDMGETAVVDLASMVDDLVQEARSSLGRMDAQVDITLGISRIRCHPAYFREVLANLIANAFKYGGRPLQVKVEAFATGQSQDQDQDQVGGRDVVVRVSDNGPGVPEADRGRVFAPFVRLQADGEGTGFGLTIVRKLVQLHGGSVHVSNGALGGACFEVRLPGAAA